MEFTESPKGEVGLMLDEDITKDEFFLARLSDEGDLVDEMSQFGSGDEDKGNNVNAELMRVLDEVEQILRGISENDESDIRDADDSSRSNDINSLQSEVSRLARVIQVLVDRLKNIDYSDSDSITSNHPSIAIVIAILRLKKKLNQVYEQLDVFATVIDLDE